MKGLLICLICFGLGLIKELFFHSFAHWKFLLKQSHDKIEQKDDLFMVYLILNYFSIYFLIFKLNYLKVYFKECQIHKDIKCSI